ncbi:MAG TPA: thiamine-phosphate kinase [Methylophilaceae bacterium]|nr:thiamine-phosphate kinase [Methylophilaceae bacterium]
MTSEFEIIERYFKKKMKQTALGVGDDAAMIHVRNNYQLAISSDMLIENIHFLKNTNPSHLGWKSLAVNLSDIAAMGAIPKWATLSISLPKINHTWLKKFSKGFFKCADKFGIDLIGGDTTKGPLSISITIMGESKKDEALLRSGAKINDDIWVTGQLGLASMGLANLQGQLKLPPRIKMKCIRALEIPTPKTFLGSYLSRYANSCIDISDGLIQDLRHILKASKVGASLLLNDIPCEKFIHTSKQYQFVLNGGDDYELLFTAAKKNRPFIKKIAKKTNTPVTMIGNITKKKALNILSEQGKSIKFNPKGFDHFA